MPDCYWVTDRELPAIGPTPARGSLGLPEKGFVFACLCKDHKLSPLLFDVWMRILEAVPGSVLWLLEDNRYMADKLRREAMARGLEKDRLVFADKASHDKHLARLQAADLYMDTFPYGAHTTTIDALSAGRPMLALSGRSFASRVAASMLFSIGQECMVANTVTEYEAKAVELASNPIKLQALCESIRENRLSHPLFDAERYCRKLEKAYQEIWRLHRIGASPRSFHVEALQVADG